MKYIKKPVTIDAILWNGDDEKSYLSLLGLGAKINEDFIITTDKSLLLYTLEGNMRCPIGNYVVKGVQGEFYSVRPDIFEQTYEGVD